MREREREPFTTSGRLVELLYAEIPAPARRTGGHPAKRTFQALRMEVNDELAVLRRAMPAAIDAISVGGRVVVEAYHSLEDRLVKQAFAAATRSDVPPDLPFVPEGMSRRCAWSPAAPSRPTADEIEDNPRAASVRLRAIERVRGVSMHEQLRRAPAPRSRGARGSPRPRSSGPGSRSCRGARTQRARVPFVALVSLVLLGGVIGLLLFNTSMQQAAFATTALEQQAGTLVGPPADAGDGARRARATRSGSPSRRRRWAWCPAAPRRTCSSPTGKVLGEPTPATADDNAALAGAAEPEARDPRPRPDRPPGHRRRDPAPPRCPTDAA